MYPNIPEKIFAETDIVEQCCIVGAKKDKNLVLKMYVVLAKEISENSVEAERILRSVAEEKLPLYSRPSFYEFIDTMPLTDAGKIDYRRLENS